MDGTPFYTESGGEGVPLVLLHGFAATGAAWAPVLDQLPRDLRTLVPDLPGHGKSAHLPIGGGTRGMAVLVLDVLATLGIDRAHFCGHSMGGAIACLAALAKPQCVASLTLLAPGAFGREINAGLLRRFAVASSRESLLPLIEQFYGSATAVGEEAVQSLLADRMRPDSGRIHSAIAERILDGEGQKTLPLGEIARLEIPVKLVWGKEDRITPASQAACVPDVFDVHLLDNVGHSLIDEIPGAIVHLILENMR